MSQPFSRDLHPFDVSRRPGLESEVQRALLRDRACDRPALTGEGATPPPARERRKASVDALLDAFRGLDDPHTPEIPAP